MVLNILLLGEAAEGPAPPAILTLQTVIVTEYRLAPIEIGFRREALSIDYFRPYTVRLLRPVIIE